MKQVHRRLLSLGITLVAFLAFAGWVGQEQEELKVEVETESKDAKIFSFLSPFDVDGIVLENSHGRFELTRERDSAEDIGRWRLSAPKKLEADLVVVEGILAQALPIRRRLDVPNPQNKPFEERLKDYALGKPAQTLTLKSGDKAETVQFGMGNSFDKSVYARLMQTDTIVTVADTLRHQLEKSLFDLRQKQLVEFERNAVVSLRVELGDKLLDFRKEASGWRLFDGAEAEPVALQRMEDLLQDLGALKFNRILSEELPEDLKLDTMKNRWVFTLNDGGEAPVVVSLILDVVDELEVLLGHNQGGGPYGELVRGRWPSLLKGGFQGLVDRRVIPVDTQSSLSITLRDGDGSVELISDENGENWRFEGAPEKSVDQSRVKGLTHILNSLERVRTIAKNITLEQARELRAISTTRALSVKRGAETFTMYPQSGEEPTEVWIDSQVMQVDATRLGDILWNLDDYTLNVEED